MSVKHVTGKPGILIGFGIFLLSCFIGTQSFAEKIVWHGYVDSSTYVREYAGLSKARIGAQLEGTKELGESGSLKMYQLTPYFGSAMMAFTS